MRPAEQLVDIDIGEIPEALHGIPLYIHPTADYRLKHHPDSTEPHAPDSAAAHPTAVRRDEVRAAARAMTACDAATTDRG
ncbi:hypothetical protein GCM10029978_089720 [Actinoallomurus acanthiterrae]